MFKAELYDTSKLVEQFSLVQKPDPAKLIYNQVFYTYRQALVQVIHMLLGQPSYLFYLTNIFQLDVNRYFKLSHLCPYTLKNHLMRLVDIGNTLHYIRQQTSRIVCVKNGLIRAFGYGMHGYMLEITRMLEDQLYRLQQYDGNIVWPTENMYDNRLTLLSFDRCLAGRMGQLGDIRKLLNEISVVCEGYYTYQARMVVSLLDTFNALNETRSCFDSGTSYLVRVFVPMVQFYMKIIQNWLEMDYATLQAQKYLGFFLMLEYSDKGMDKIRVNKGSIINSSLQYRMFELSNLLKYYLVPKLFRRVAVPLASLGKFIQFILLYFRNEEKKVLDDYLDIVNEFSSLRQYLEGLRVKHVSRCFYMKTHQFSSIGRRLAARPKCYFKAVTLPAIGPYHMNLYFKGAFQIFYHPNTLTNNKEFNNKTKVGQALTILYPSTTPILPSQSSTPDNLNITIYTHLLHLINRINNKCGSLLQNNFLHQPILNHPYRIHQSLSRTFTGIRKFMLFYQGDFIHYLLILVYNLFDKPSDKIPRSVINRCIEESVRLSNARYLENTLLDNLSFMFLRGEAGQKKYLKGWTVFSLLYQPYKPVDCIFTSKIMYTYAEIFNFIFNIKRCEFTIKYIWSMCNIEAKTIVPIRMIKGRQQMYDTHLYQQQSEGRPHNYLYKIMFVRNCIHHYVNCLMSYVLNHVHYEWNQFYEDAAKAVHVTDIIDRNRLLLGRLGRLTLGDSIVCNCLLLLIEVIDKMTELLTRKDIMKELDMLNEYFRSIVYSSRQVPQLQDLLDFNSHYDL